MQFFIVVMENMYQSIPSHIMSSSIYITACFYWLPSFFYILCSSLYYNEGQLSCWFEEKKSVLLHGRMYCILHFLVLWYVMVCNMYCIIPGACLHVELISSVGGRSMGVL
jgi:hypothetical protein